MGLFDFFRRPPDRAGFARLMEKSLREAGETRPIHFDVPEFRLVVGGPQGLACYLGNIYEEYCRSRRRDRADALRRFAQASRQAGSLPATLDRWESARPRLLPRLRERMYLENRRISLELQGKPAPALPCRPLTEHLVVVLVYDLPDSMLEIGLDTLTRWDVPFDDALDAARDNLWTLSKERLLPLRPGVWRSPWGDNYDASRLLLHDLVWQYPVKGAHVAAAPHRDTLLVTGSEDVEGLRDVLSRSLKALESPRPMGARAVVLEGSRWVPLRLPPGHPVYPLWRRAEILTQAADCAEQKGLLEALHQKRDDDLFVASFSATERPETREISSYAVWSEGLPTLLPRTDRVAFIRPSLPEAEQVVGLVPWDRVLAAFGPLMVPQGSYPERWRVDAFPSPQEIRALLLR